MCDLIPILAITKNTTIDAEICEHLNKIIATTIPHARKYGKRDNVKVSVIASALQTIGLFTGVLQVEPDHQHQNYEAIRGLLHQFVLSHSPDQLHLVLNEPRTVGDALSEFTYPDLEALAFPKAIQDQVQHALHMKIS